jgi:hypothetical protein
LEDGSPAVFQTLLDWEMEALAEYRTRGRTGPRVIAYFERAGLGDLLKAQGADRENGCLFPYFFTSRLASCPEAGK